MELRLEEQGDGGAPAPEVPNAAPEVPNALGKRERAKEGAKEGAEEGWEARLERVRASNRYRQWTRPLNEAQRSVVERALAGERLVVTGKGGSGKSYVTRVLYKICTKLLGAPMFVVASTGVAAQLLEDCGAMTIHSFFGLTPDLLEQSPADVVAALRRRNWECAREAAMLRGSGPGAPGRNELTQVSQLSRQLEDWYGTPFESDLLFAHRLRSARLLCVDEVSMVSAHLMETMDLLARSFRGCWDQPFGGLQVIAVGDFFQLPPVEAAHAGGGGGGGRGGGEGGGWGGRGRGGRGRGGRGAGWRTEAEEARAQENRRRSVECFRSHHWVEWFRWDQHIELPRSFRQDGDVALMDLLDELRSKPEGVPLSAQAEACLFSRYQQTDELLAQMREGRPPPVYLFATNALADACNAAWLAQLPGTAVVFTRESACSYSRYRSAMRAALRRRSEAGEAEGEGGGGESPPEVMSEAVFADLVREMEQRVDEVVVLKPRARVMAVVNAAWPWHWAVDDARWRTLVTSLASFSAAPPSSQPQLLAPPAAVQAGGARDEAPALWPLANGSLGWVVRVLPAEVHVKFDHCPSRIVRVGVSAFQHPRCRQVEVSQLGLRAAWGMTMHKSQGNTFERVAVELSGIFAPGQAYVALSRAKTLAGLWLSRVDEQRGERLAAFLRRPESMASAQTFATSALARALYAWMRAPADPGAPALRAAVVALAPHALFTTTGGPARGGRGGVGGGQGAWLHASARR